MASRGALCYLGGREMRQPSIVRDDGWHSADYVYHCVAIRYTPRAAAQLIALTTGRPVIPVDEILPWHCCWHGNPHVNPNKHGVADRAILDAWAVPDWIVTQSGDFRGTETNDCAVDLHVLIPASDPARAKDAVAAYTALGYQPTIIGAGAPAWDTKGEGGSPKLHWIKDALGELPADSWTLICDGYDTLPAVDPDETVSRLIEMDADIVLGGEKNHWPNDADLKARIEARPDRGMGKHVYPNSGVIGADTGILRALLGTTDDFGADDQRWWQERYVRSDTAAIRVDSESYLSLQAHGADHARRNGRVLDAAHRCWPAIVHGNCRTNMDTIRPLPTLTKDMSTGLLDPQAGEWIEVADGILAMPFLRPEVCQRICESAAMVPSLWQALYDDPVPGDELRIDVFDPGPARSDPRRTGAEGQACG